MSFYRRKKRTRVAPKARNKEEKCITKRCRNRKAVKYTRYQSASGKIIKYESSLPRCWKCQARLLKERHPHTYVLNILRLSAKRRKLPFTLTLDQFKAFCDRTQYLERRGHGPGLLTIDRKDSNRGYHIDNIQVMEFMENCTKEASNMSREERGAESTDDNEPF